MITATDTDVVVLGIKFDYQILMIALYGCILVMDKRYIAR